MDEVKGNGRWGFHTFDDLVAVMRALDLLMLTYHVHATEAGAWELVVDDLRESLTTLSAIRQIATAERGRPGERLGRIGELAAGCYLDWSQSRA